MVEKTTLFINISLLVLAVLGTRSTFAGGFYLPHQTARGVGLSNAQTAGVNDPSAVYYNPAALSEVEGNQILLTGNYINVVNSVENSGRTAENQHNDNFTATLFGNYHIPRTDVTLGVGMYTPFGLATSYGGGFARFAARRTELKTLYITPAVSWSPSKFFSVGGGFSFVHSSAILRRSLCFDPLFGCAFPGGEEKIRISDTDNAYSYNVGVLLKPIDKVKIGFSYRGRAELNFDHADTKLNGFAAAKTKANVRPITLPPIINAGIFWQMTPAWGAELVYEFQRWSEFNAIRAKFSPPPFGISSFTLTENWKDSNTLRLGSFYRLTKNWELRGGLGLEQSPIPNKTLNPAIPGADLLTLNGGIGYNWEGFSVDLGYQAVFYKTRRVNNRELEGAWRPGCGAPGGCPFSGAPGKDKYETFNNFVSLSLGYRF
ncbi:MAG TPA: outer membrane protein transport protein [Candidatus Binatia bacterium]|jgi:long-chain fatty acid transport protein